MTCLISHSTQLVITRAHLHVPACSQPTARRILLPATRLVQNSDRVQRFTPCAQPSPQADQLQLHPTLSAQHILSALEVGAWFCAVGLQACAFGLAYQQYQELITEQETEQCEAQAEIIPPHTWSDHLCRSPSLITQGAVFAIILAAMIGRFRQWLSHGRKLVTDGNDSTSASAQLVRLGVLADRQAQSLTVVERQITKLQLRTRLMGRDVKPLLKTVQHENLQQAEVLNNHGQQLEAMQNDIQDTQKLLFALQSVSAKQFDLLMKVFRQQQQQQQPKLKQIDKTNTLEQLDHVVPHQA